MKTKVKISIFICLLFVLAEVSAQQTYSYYTATQTLGSMRDENSSMYYTYRSEVDQNIPLVLLCNSTNTRTNAEQTFKDGSPLTESLLMGNEKLIETDNWTWEKSHSIVDDAFSAAEKQRIKDDVLLVDIVIDSNTGRIVEVEFTFRNDKGFATIPVSVYRRIELRLKNEVWFTLTDIAKSLNYVTLGWNQRVK